MNTILAVDKDAAVHERETSKWEKYGVNTLRVDTMTEAITMLAHRDDFLFIAINEDTIPGFMSQIRIMRDVTSSAIFVITSNHTIEKKIKAMGGGADVYAHFNDYIKENVINALTLLKAKKRRSTRTLKQSRVLTGRDVVLSPFRRSVFVKDAKVPLTKKEFDVLQYLMEGNEYVVPHARLMRKVWGNKRELKDIDVLWRTVDRIRRKFSAISPPTNRYIEIEHGVGYRFSASTT